MSEELKEKIEEIFMIPVKERPDGLVEYEVGINEGQLDQLLELFEKYAKEIIGEDDAPYEFNNGQRVQYRNELRAEQRSRLESHKKEEV